MKLPREPLSVLHAVVKRTPDGKERRPARSMLPCGPMTTADRIFPLCELLLGAAYSDGELQAQEATEIRALLIELAGESRVEVEACIASFEPAKFELDSIIGYFRDDPADQREKLLILASKVVDADDVVDLAENEYLRTLAAALALPPSALDGLATDIELEEVQETFDVVRKGPPPIPPRSRAD